MPCVQPRGLGFLKAVRDSGIGPATSMPAIHQPLPIRGGAGRTGAVDAPEGLTIFEDLIIFRSIVSVGIVFDGSSREFC